MCPRVVALLQGRVGDVVDRIGDAFRVAEPTVQLEALLVEGDGRREVALVEGEDAGAGERVRAKRGLVVSRRRAAAARTSAGPPRHGRGSPRSATARWRAGGRSAARRPPMRSSRAPRAGCRAPARAGRARRLPRARAGAPWRHVRSAPGTSRDGDVARRPPRPPGRAARSCTPGGSPKGGSGPPDRRSRRSPATCRPASR